MKNIEEYIDESKSDRLRPTSNRELREIIKQRISERGPKCDLNDIDVSGMTDMYEMFANSDFNGDISKWDVSHVETMDSMFANSKFDGDISKWDVSSVRNMHYMFANSKFDGDLSKWDVSNVRDKTL